MVAVIQSFGSFLKRNPHIHAIVSRGVFFDDGSWYPIPYVDSHKAELVFRQEVLVDPFEFLARVLIHVPEPRKHLVRFYGVYANRIRATYRAEDTALPGEQQFRAAQHLDRKARPRAPPRAAAP